MADNPNAPIEGASPPVDPNHPMYKGSFWDHLSPQRSPAVLRKVTRSRDRADSQGSESDQSRDGSDASGESGGSKESGGSNQSSASSMALGEHLGRLAVLNSEQQIEAVDALLGNPGVVVSLDTPPDMSDAENSPKCERAISRDYHPEFHRNIRKLRHEALELDDAMSYSSDADLGLEASHAAYADLSWHWRRLAPGDVVDVSHLSITALQLDCLRNLSVAYGFTLRAKESFTANHLLCSTESLRAAHDGQYDALCLLEDLPACSPCQGVRVDYEDIAESILQRLAAALKASPCRIVSIELAGVQHWGVTHWHAWLAMLEAVHASVESIAFPHIHSLALVEPSFSSDGESSDDNVASPAAAADEIDVGHPVERWRARMDRQGLERERFHQAQDEQITVFNECVNAMRGYLQKCACLRTFTWDQVVTMDDVYGAVGDLMLTDDLRGKLVCPAFDPEIMTLRFPSAESTEASYRSSVTHYLSDTLASKLDSFSSDDDLTALESIRPNTLTIEGWETFFKLIAIASMRVDGVRKIFSLDLDGASPTESGLRTLADLLRANAPIGTLNLSNNAISTKAMLALARGMQSNDKLRHLLMSGVDEVDVSHHALCRAIQDSSLLSVNVARCPLRIDTLRALLKACIDNAQIRHVNFEDVVVVDDDNQLLSASNKAKEALQAIMNALRMASTSVLDRVHCGNGVDIHRDPMQVDRTGFNRLVLLLPGTLRMPMSMIIALNEALGKISSPMAPNTVQYKDHQFQYPPSLGRTIQVAPAPASQLGEMIDASNIDQLEILVNRVGDFIFDHYAKHESMHAMSLYERVAYYDSELRRFISIMAEDLKDIHVDVGVVMRRAVTWWLSSQSAEHVSDPMLLCVMALLVEDRSVHGPMQAYAFDSRGNNRRGFARPFSTDAFLYGQYLNPFQVYRPDQKAIFERISSQPVSKPWLTQEDVFHGLAFVAFVAGLFCGAWLALSVFHLSIPWLLGVSMLERTASLWGVLVGVSVAYLMYRRFLLGAKPELTDAVDEADKPFKVRMDGATRQYVLNFFGGELPVSRSPDAPVETFFSFFRPATASRPFVEDDDLEMSVANV